MRWRLIIVYSFLSLPFMWLSFPLVLSAFGISNKAFLREEIFALIGAIAFALGVCLYIQRTWDFARLQPYDPIKHPPAASAAKQGVIITVWLIAIVNTLTNLLLDSDGKQRFLEGFSFAIVVMLWFMIIQAWRHRHR